MLYTPPDLSSLEFTDSVIVYVFRDGSFVGAAAKIEILLDGTYQAVLGNNTFSYFITKRDKHNTVLARNSLGRWQQKVFFINQMTAGESLTGKRVNNIIYLKTWFAMGMLKNSPLHIEEIDKREGQKLIKKYKYTELSVDDINKLIYGVKP